MARSAAFSCVTNGGLPATAASTSSRSPNSCNRKARHKLPSSTACFSFMLMPEGISRKAHIFFHAKFGRLAPQAAPATAAASGEKHHEIFARGAVGRLCADAIICTRGAVPPGQGRPPAQQRMMKYAINAYGIATGGGTLAYQTLAPTAAKADKMVDDRLATPITADANDFIYQWEASHDYNPSAGLERIEATLLAINAADDERNPPETRLTDSALKRVKNGRLYLIPASTETRGHLTTGSASFYKQQLQELLQTSPERTM